MIFFAAVSVASAYGIAIALRSRTPPPEHAVNLAFPLEPAVYLVVNGGNADALLGHLLPGSMQVRTGASVAVGDWLGSAGNSCNTGEPHLHVHAQRPGPGGAPLGGDPLPILFDGRHPVRGDRIESR